jgi:Aminoglycoside-2''-adenylyltransferase
MADFPCPWAFCGGWAIDLFLDRVTRPHRDIDLAVFRRDQPQVHAHFARYGWTIEQIVNGKPIPWLSHQPLELPVHEVWCTNPADPAERVELLFNESNDRDFVFRRDPMITLPLDRAIVRSPAGLAFLAPEIVLLYKSRQPDVDHNLRDLEWVLPALREPSRDWLAQALARLDPKHPWLALVRG